MKELTVTYQGLGTSFVLGTLADDGQDVLFQYAPQALERGLQLSPIRLPLRAPAYPDRRADYMCPGSSMTPCLMAGVIA